MCGAVQLHTPRNEPVVTVFCSPSLFRPLPPAQPTSVANADWWFIQVALPDDIFKMDYVIMDKNTGLVDNNGYKVRHGWHGLEGAGSGVFAGVILLGVLLRVQKRCKFTPSSLHATPVAESKLSCLCVTPRTSMCP